MNTSKRLTLPTCSKCGAKVQPDDRFCGNCGIALELSPKAQPQKASLENDLPLPTTESPAGEYEFQTKGSRIFGTQVYVPKTSPRREYDRGRKSEGEDSSETLNQHLSGLLTAIHGVETRLFWYTVAILFFILVLVALTGYDILFRQKP